MFLRVYLVEFLATPNSSVIIEPMSFAIACIVSHHLDNINWSYIHNGLSNVAMDVVSCD
jgi:hypothetical protein